MNTLDHFRALCERILAGDESTEASRFLEAFVIDKLTDTESSVNLLEKLAMYAPGAGAPYVQPEELRQAVRAALDELEHPG